MALPPTVRIASLCSGGGGLDLGVVRALDRLGRSHRAVMYVEREAYAAAVLASRMEEGALAAAPIWSDLATFDGERLRGAVDLVVAGVPCQGNSVAGKRLGRSDERWLWPVVERFLAGARPAWFFLENVRGLLSVDAGGAFEDILRSLARLGFDAEWCVLGARDVGAPHRRERVFLLAHTKSQRLGVGDAWPEGTGRSESDRRDSSLAHAERAGCKRRSRLHVSTGHESAEAHSPPTRRGQVFPPCPDDDEGWRVYLADHPDHTPATESTLCRSPDGLASGLVDPRADRLRLLGNGVVPEQAAVAFEHLYQRSL